MMCKLIHGDCLEILRTLNDNAVDLTVTSPPYNCRKDYGGYDDMIAWPDYYAWMGDVLKELYRVTRVGGTIAINVPSVIRWQAVHKHAGTWADYDPDYRTHRDGKKVVGRGRLEPIGFRLFEMMQEIDKHVREPIVWVKGSEGNAICTEYRMGCDSDPYMRPAHEFILLGSKGQWYHRGGTGRRERVAVPYLEYTKDVWFITPAREKSHPAVFPVEIPRRLIRLFTHAEDAVVLDPFMGLGATGIAAMEQKRRFIGIDLNGEYVKIAEGRIREARSETKGQL